MKVCIVGASRKLGRYMVQHSLDRRYEVIAVCREQSVAKLADFVDNITIFPGATDDREARRKTSLTSSYRAYGRFNREDTRWQRQRHQRPSNRP